MSCFNFSISSLRARAVIMMSLLLCSFTSPAFQWSSLTANNIYTLHAGNVGIGSTSPVSKLEVASASNARILLRSTAASNPAIFELVGPASSALIELAVTPSMMTRIGSKTNHDVSIITGNAERLLIKADGKVGVGKNPAFALDVNGIINATSFLIGGQTLVPSQWISNGPNINFSSGIVSIGTTRTPLGYRLAVGGKIITEEVVVRLQVNWPDFVFDQEYKLPPLSQVKRYIEAHKRLPDLPDATQVSSKGLAIGELNTILVRKIEELTLYLIEQENRIAQLEKLIERK